MRRKALERLGLGRETLCQYNPELLYVFLSGFAEQGPNAGRPAYDDLIQGMTALPDLVARANRCAQQYPMTKKGRGGAALGITMMSSFFAASFGIIVMIFLSPALVKIAFEFGPAEISAIMLLGLTAGATMTRGSPIKGIAMTVFGLLCGAVGTDVADGTFRFTFDIHDLRGGIELGALCMGLFAIADFLVNVNRTQTKSEDAKVRMRDMLPTWQEIKISIMPMIRGTLVGSMFGAMPGTLRRSSSSASACSVPRVISLTWAWCRYTAL
jgi:TctA family transporter